MSQKKATFEAVHDACRTLLDDGKPLSATNILAKVGGSKQTVLEVRKEVIAKLMEDGHMIDPSAAFQAAADPLVRKLWSIGRQQAEASFARRVRDLGTINEGLELDVDALQESLEDAQHRADAAEARLDEIMKNYEDLRDAFQVLAASVRDGTNRSGTARAPKPSQVEIAGVLAALERLAGPITHERLYTEMAKDGWDENAAQKARYRVMGAKLAEHVIAPTEKGLEWLEESKHAARAADEKR
jgi:outer membrane murein-binding lipoprotein Lpp